MQHSMVFLFQHNSFDHVNFHKRKQGTACPAGIIEPILSAEGSGVHPEEGVWTVAFHFIHLEDTFVKPVELKHSSTTPRRLLKNS